ncbi:unnamed protein product [Thelazia callipaeda]|uniref:BTB domain-containing protein n=1 Tax=Thelazia callipaeda TaxID=103827 RepID=A0A0N5CRP9_THECL|nr:unnamed protein product [Thelazia callipaeda]
MQLVRLVRKETEMTLLSRDTCTKLDPSLVILIPTKKRDFSGILLKEKQKNAVNKLKNLIDFHLLLNIGGTHYRIRNSTIQYRCPSSLLAEFSRETHSERIEKCDGYIRDTKEYFFERSGKLFEPIYDFLTTGHFHRPGDICRERLFKELDFWNIKKDLFAPCCMSMAMGESEEEESQNLPDGSVAYSDQFDGVCYAKQRRMLWLVLEDPSSNTAAKLFAILSITMVLTSVTGMILGSVPEWQGTLSANHTAHNKLDFRSNSTLESIELASFVAHAIGDVRGIAMVMRVVRVMRVARVFKLARYSSGLKSFGMTVKTSLAELSMLSLFLLTAVIFFSTLMYFAERDEPNTKFKSIAHAGWWCIVTMTTVGYGDYCPETLFGKLIASCASISGVLVLAFPITMIVENFSRTYDSERKDFKRVQRRRRMAKAYN